MEGAGNDDLHHEAHREVVAELVAYASRTGTRTTLAALRAAGWRLLVSASGVHRTEGMRYAIDNGAYSAWDAHRRGKRSTPLLDKHLFIRIVITLGPFADFVVVPDIVQGGAESLALSLRWLPWVLLRTRRALIAVQDGMTAEQIGPHLNERVGVFVGGGDKFKETSTPMWAVLARSRGAYCHVGRVNTRRRINIAAAAGVDSFDGTSVTQFPSTLKKIERWKRQQSLLLN